MTIYFSSGTDEYGWLSNFYHTQDTQFRIGDTPFNSVEQAYQCYKGANKNAFDYVWKGIFPNECKRRGRKVVLTDNWELKKIPVMSMCVLAKFEQNQFLKDKLLATGDEILVEYTTWNDTFWGVNTNYEGSNHLGKIIMSVRHVLSI